MKKGRLARLGRRAATARAAAGSMVLMSTTRLPARAPWTTPSGLDVEQVRRVMTAGMASSRVLEGFGARMASRDFRAGIESRLYHKDLDIALRLAHGSGAAVPAASVTMQFVNALMGRGRSRDDLSALIAVVDEMAAPVAFAEEIGDDG